MATELGVAYLSLTASTKDFASEVRKALGEVEDEAGKTGQRSGSKIGGGIKTGMKIAGGAIAGVAGIVAGIALKGGITRALQIEDAQAKLKGLGHSTESVQTIMDSALDSVRGTAFGLGDAATVAAAVVAAGVAPGEDLTRTLSLVADASTIAGTSMGDMGGIFNKVASTNKVQGDVLNQLGERGIPILQLLAAEMGVSAEEVAKLASQGKVDFATFQSAIESGMGGAALESGETFRGAMANTGAALGRLGEKVVGGVLPQIKDSFGDAIGVLDEWAPHAEAAGKAIGEGLATAIDWIRNDLIPAIQSTVKWFRENATTVKIVAGVIAAALLPVLASIVAAWVRTEVAAIKSSVKQFAAHYKVVAGWVMSGAAAVRSAAQTVAVWALYKAQAIKGAAITVASHARMAAAWVASRVTAVASMAITVASMVAGWAVMGAQALLGAAKVALAWIIAMGPIALVIAAVVGLVALIIANWDKIVAWTKQAWESVTAWLSQAWENITTGVTTAWNAILDFFKAIPGKLLAFFLNFTLIGLLIKHWDKIKSGATKAWNALVDFVKKIPQRFIDGLKAIGTMVASSVRGWVSTVRDRAVERFTALVEWVKGVPGRFVSGLKAIGTTVASNVGGWVRNIRDKAVERFTNLVDWVKGLPGRIVSALGNLGNLLKDAGRKVIQGLIDGIKGAFSGVKDTLSNLTSSLPDWKGPASVDRKILAGPADLIMGGFVSRLEDNYGDVRRSLMGLTADLPTSVNVNANPVRANGHGAAGPGLTQNIYPTPGMSERQVGDMAARRVELAFVGMPG